MVVSPRCRDFFAANPKKQHHNNTMAKPTATKPSLKPAAKPAAVPVATPAAVAKTRSRDTVLVLKTPNELVKLVGGDTPIGVSRKSLLTVITKQKIGDLKAESGL